MIGVLLLSAGLTLTFGYAGQVYAQIPPSGGGNTSPPPWDYPYYYYPYGYSSGTYAYYSPSNSCSSNYANYYYYYSSYYCRSRYTLSISTDPGSIGTVNGGDSYLSGSSASFYVTKSTVQVSSNTRYVFDHWSGDYSGVGPNGTVTVNGAMKITAVYQLQYYLTINVQPANAQTAQGAGWYNVGTTATVLSGNRTVGDSFSRLVFQGWSVDGQPAKPNSTLSVVMNAPHAATAVYQQQYYLNVRTDLGVPFGSGWYGAGSTAQISVSTPVSTQYGVSIIFNGWIGDTNSTSQSTSIFMDGPKDVIATWRKDSTVLYATIIGAIMGVVSVTWVVLFLLTQRNRRTSKPAALKTSQFFQSHSELLSTISFLVHIGRDSPAKAC